MKVGDILAQINLKSASRFLEDFQQSYVNLAIVFFDLLLLNWCELAKVVFSFSLDYFFSGAYFNSSVNFCTVDFKSKSTF